MKSKSIKLQDVINLIKDVMNVCKRFLSVQGLLKIKKFIKQLKI